MVDNYGFLDDTRLVAATLRSVGFYSESDWITSEGVDYESRIDLFSFIEDSCDLLHCAIGIDTDGVVSIY